MEKKTHYFYALKLPKDVKIQLQEIQKELQTNFPFSRWVHPEDYHITLAFLGHANREQLLSSITLVQEALKSQDSFSLTINQLGIFGRSDSPRIFWADVEKEKRLFEIRDLVFSACVKAQFILETRPFHPHITLARKWTGSQPFSNNLFDFHNPFATEPIPFLANEVVLYETHLEKEPKYEVKESFLLQ